jgi:hypothetical protein
MAAKETSRDSHSNPKARMASPAFYTQIERLRGLNNVDATGEALRRDRDWLSDSPSSGI